MRRGVGLMLTAGLASLMVAACGSSGTSADKAAVITARSTCREWLRAPATAQVAYVQAGGGPKVSASSAEAAAAAGNRLCRKEHGGTTIPSAATLIGVALLESATSTSSGNSSEGGSGSTTKASTTATITAPGAYKGDAVWRNTSPSMYPGLAVGTEVITQADAPIRLGSIVVFHPPTGADPVEPVCGNPSQGAGHPQACEVPTAAVSSQTFIKRVVGLPGDRLRIVKGHVYRNGVRAHEPFVQPCDSGPANCTFPETITVPAGSYYMMGDNRGESDDSRFWGPVAAANIVGVVILCVPMTRYCTTG